MSWRVLLTGSIDLAIAQLRFDRVSTVLAVTGVTLAVLSTTLLAGAGLGAVHAGIEKYDATGRDLWITGTTEITPGTVGGLSPGIYEAHRMTTELETHPNIRTAAPMAIQAVYAGTDPNELHTITGVGVPGNRLKTQILVGRYFDGDDIHYANGTYAGPMTKEAVISSNLASQLNVSVGDQIHLGGTIITARQTQFTVIGISDAFAGFLGSPVITVRLSELQEITGKTALDSASVLMITVDSEAQLMQTAHDLQRRYPEYDVRTNQEQLRATLDRHALIIASAVILVCLAIAAGLALTTNILLQFIHQQQQSIAAALAQGASMTVIGFVVSQGIIIGMTGGILGLLLTPIVMSGLNSLMKNTFGLTGFLEFSSTVALLGFGVSLGMSILTASVAGWRLTSLTVGPSLDSLRD